MSLDERPRGSARPTPKEHYNTLPRTSIEGALALAEKAGTVVVTADDKLLETQGDSHYVHLGHPLVDAENLVSGAR
jgi:hypothetical protein